MCTMIWKASFYLLAVLGVSFQYILNASDLITIVVTKQMYDVTIQLLFWNQMVSLLSLCSKLGLLKFIDRRWFFLQVYLLLAKWIPQQRPRPPSPYGSLWAHTARGGQQPRLSENRSQKKNWSQGFKATRLSMRKINIVCFWYCIYVTLYLCPYDTIKSN